MPTVWPDSSFDADADDDGYDDYEDFEDETDTICACRRGEVVAMFDRNKMKWETALSALIRDGHITLTAEQEKLPASVKEAAVERVERCMRRIDTVTEGVAGLPPGFELDAAPNGVWQVVPPPEHEHLLIKAITHPALELAIAFAWEVARGEIDPEETRALAQNVAATLIERGDLSPGPEPEVASKVLGLLIGAEMLSGYMSMAERFGGERALTR